MKPLIAMLKSTDNEGHCSIIKAPAKVNLWLHVMDKRADGYHNLESLVVFAEQAYDAIEAQLTEDGSITVIVKGNEAASLLPEENLVKKAALWLKEHTKVAFGAVIILKKYLPMSAGIGGGSSDAASTLRLLKHLWKIELPEDAWRSLCLRLGADVPACWFGNTVFMQGIGEKLTPLSLPFKLPAVLVNNRLPIATPAIFKSGQIHFSLPEKEISLPTTFPSFIKYLQNHHNALEPAALHLVPEIAETLLLLSQQEGCVLARMSGSGATCFGIFENDYQGEKAAKTITSLYPEWWVQKTWLG